MKFNCKFIWLFESMFVVVVLHCQPISEVSYCIIITSFKVEVIKLSTCYTLMKCNERPIGL